MPDTTFLNQLHPGQCGRISKVHGHNPLRQRFLDMGLVRNTQVEVVSLAPLGDPMQINVRGYHLAIRKREAGLIEIIPLDLPETAGSGAMHTYAFSLPTLRLHSCEDGHSTPVDAAHTILLAGNPNCGKSTLFNALTGSHQHVGNWPGKTVEKKEGLWSENGTRFRVVDLPGIYSLTAYSLEEVIARDAILSYHADLVVVVVDAANLERNLYLAVQIMEMGAPVLLALNMWDMAQAQGIHIDLAGLSLRLRVPVLPTALSRGLGLVELKQRMQEMLIPAGACSC